MGAEPVNESVTVLIENTYACGQESSIRVEVPAPRQGQNLDSWWEDDVFDKTGDGHSCGASEHALCEVRIVEAPGRPELISETTSWEG
jgi:hypothetical protein